MDEFISVVTPTYNKIPRLEIALESLNYQTYPIDKWELILVDDGSTDNVSAVLDRLAIQYNCKYVYQKNAGRSVARNTGVQHAKGDTIVFMDDDLIASPNFISAHAKAHQNDAEVVVHGAIYDLLYTKFFLNPIEGILFPEFADQTDSVEGLRIACSKILLFKQNFNEFSKKFRKKSYFEKGIQKVLSLPPEEQAVSWMGFTGGNVSVSRSMFERAGRFDIQLGKTWGAEDIELGYRISQLGAKWLYSNEASNYHITHYKKDIFNIGKGPHDYCRRKHPGNGMAYLWEYLLGNLNILEFNQIAMDDKRRSLNHL